MNPSLDWNCRNHHPNENDRFFVFPWLRLQLTTGILRPSPLQTRGWQWAGLQGWTRCPDFGRGVGPHLENNGKRTHQVKLGSGVCSIWSWILRRLTFHFCKTVFFFPHVCFSRGRSSSLVVDKSPIVGLVLWCNDVWSWNVGTNPQKIKTTFATIFLGVCYTAANYGNWHHGLVPRNFRRFSLDYHSMSQQKCLLGFNLWFWEWWTRSYSVWHRSSCCEKHTKTCKKQRISWDSTNSTCTKWGFTMENRSLKASESHLRSIQGFMV